MPTCLNCKNPFPNRKIISGKIRILNSRKYCLECSPFGKHNTRHFGYIKLGAVEHACPCCHKPHADKTRLCNSCQTNLRRYEVKQRAIAYLGGKCIHCGYNKCVGALEFHHRDPKQKSFQIAGSHCRSWQSIQKELDKCDLICSNCHAEKHWGESEKYRLYQAKWRRAVGTIHTPGSPEPSV